MKSPSRLADFSLNWIIRDSSPYDTVHSMIQHSWVCSGTCDCTNTVATSGSSPTAKSMAASFTVDSPITPGVSVIVRAWRSTMPWKASCSCWPETQFRSAPR